MVWRSATCIVQSPTLGSYSLIVWLPLDDQLCRIWLCRHADADWQRLPDIRLLDGCAIFADIFLVSVDGSTALLVVRSTTALHSMWLDPLRVHSSYTSSSAPIGGSILKRRHLVADTRSNFESHVASQWHELLPLPSAHFQPSQPYLEGGSEALPDVWLIPTAITQEANSEEKTQMSKATKFRYALQLLAMGDDSGCRLALFIAGEIWLSKPLIYGQPIAWQEKRVVVSTDVGVLRALAPDLTDEFVGSITPVAFENSSLMISFEPMTSLYGLQWSTWDVSASRLHVEWRQSGWRSRPVACFLSADIALIVKPDGCMTAMNPTGEIATFDIQSISSPITTLTRLETSSQSPHSNNNSNEEKEYTVRVLAGTERGSFFILQVEMLFPPVVSIQCEVYLKTLGISVLGPSFRSTESRAVVEFLEVLSRADCEENLSSLLCMATSPNGIPSILCLETAGQVYPNDNLVAACQACFSLDETSFILPSVVMNCEASILSGEDCFSLTRETLLERETNISILSRLQYGICVLPIQSVLISDATPGLRLFSLVTACRKDGDRDTCSLTLSSPTDSQIVVLNLTNNFQHIATLTVPPSNTKVNSLTLAVCQLLVTDEWLHVTSDGMLAAYRTASSTQCIGSVWTKSLVELCPDIGLIIKWHGATHFGQLLVCWSDTTLVLLRLETTSNRLNCITWCQFNDSISCVSLFSDPSSPQTALVAIGWWTPEKPIGIFTLNFNSPATAFDKPIMQLHSSSNSMGAIPTALCLTKSKLPTNSNGEECLFAAVTTSVGDTSVWMLSLNNSKSPPNCLFFTQFSAISFTVIDTPHRIDTNSTIYCTFLATSTSSSAVLNITSQSKTNISVDFVRLVLPDVKRIWSAQWLSGGALDGGPYLAVLASLTNSRHESIPLDDSYDATNIDTEGLIYLCIGRLLWQETLAPCLLDSVRLYNAVLDTVHHDPRAGNLVILSQHKSQSESDWHLSLHSCYDLGVCSSINLTKRLSAVLPSLLAPGSTLPIVSLSTSLIGPWWSPSPTAPLPLTILFRDSSQSLHLLALEAEGEDLSLVPLAHLVVPIDEKNSVAVDPWIAELPLHRSLILLTSDGYLTLFFWKRNSTLSSFRILALDPIEFLGSWSAHLVHQKFIILHSVVTGLRLFHILTDRDDFSLKLLLSSPGENQLTNITTACLEDSSGSLILVYGWDSLVSSFRATFFFVPAIHSYQSKPPSLRTCSCVLSRPLLSDVPTTHKLIPISRVNQHIEENSTPLSTLWQSTDTHDNLLHLFTNHFAWRDGYGFLHRVLR